MIRKCETCQVEFEALGKGSFRKSFCSIECRLTRFEHVCVHCEQGFRGKHKIQSFCSRSCQASWRNKRITIIDSWKQKYSDNWEVRYAEWKTKMSKVTSGENNGMHGRRHNDAAKERIAVRTRGKTLVEIYGIKRAQLIRSKISDRSKGDQNPAFGKVYMNGGKSVKGHYKGKFFRSLLEYSFMKHLESKGLSLENDVDYECFTIPYQIDGGDRTYRVDFYVSQDKKIYEVKPSYALTKLSIVNQAKWNAAHIFAEQRGLEFFVVTEANFPKIAFEDAKNDSDVVWKTETFKYFKAGRK